MHHFLQDIDDYFQKERDWSNEYAKYMKDLSTVRRKLLNRFRCNSAFMRVLNFRQRRSKTVKLQTSSTNMNM